MKLILFIHSGDRPETVTDLLRAHDVHAWTALAPARGAGASGRREGTRAWPGGSNVFLTMVEDERVDALCNAIHAARAQLPAGERLHAAVMPVERFS